MLVARGIKKTEEVNGKLSVGTRMNGGVGGVNGRVEGRMNGGGGGKPFGSQVQVFCVFLSIIIYRRMSFNRLTAVDAFLRQPQLLAPNSR